MKNNLKNHKKKEPPARGIDEMNIAELPVTVAGRGVKDTSREFTLPNGGKLNIYSSPDIGLPTHEDKPYLLALLKIANDSGFDNDEQHFSSYELLKFLGHRPEGKVYKKLTRGFKKLSGALYTAEGCWWDNEKKTRVGISAAFHLIDAYYLWYEDKKSDKPLDPEAIAKKDSWVRFGKEFLRSIRSNFIKAIDFNYYRSLRLPLSKDLYEILSKFFYKRDIVPIDVFELGNRLGLKEYKHPSEIWRKTKPACDELKSTCFLKNYKYESPTVTFTKNPDFYPSQKQKTLPFVETKPKPEHPEDPDVKELISHFHTSLGHEKWRTPKGELNYAATLLKNHSLEDAKLIVNLAIERAPESFDMQTLNAIDQWLDQAEEELKQIKEAKAQAEQQARIAQARKKEEEERRKREEAEARKLDAIFASLGPSQKAKIEKEAEQRLNSIEKRLLQRDRKQGQISDLTKLSLDIKIRKVLKDWLSSGKIKTDNESSA